MWTTTLMLCEGVAVGRGRGRLMGLDEGEARELNAIAGVLEALALSVAPAFDALEIAELRIAGYRFRWSGDDASSLAVADHDFHSRLVERCGDEAGAVSTPCPSPRSRRSATRSTAGRPASSPILPRSRARPASTMRSSTRWPPATT
jgi:hypothetical protein